MNTLIAVTALLSVAAATPGPNNLLVMRAAAHGGFAAALPAVAAIVAGSITLLVVVVAGVGHAFVAWPPLRMLVAAGGAAYLVWLGGRLILANDGEHADAALPAGALGVFGFQFLNPKGWVMVLAVVAATPSRGALDTLATLAPLFVCIPLACLLLWTGLGSVMSRHLARPATRLWTDRVLGALLVVSTLFLFV